MNVVSSAPAETSARSARSAAAPLAVAHYTVSRPNAAPLFPTAAASPLPAGTTVAEALGAAHELASRYTLQTVRGATQTYVNQAQAVLQAADGQLSIVPLGAYDRSATRPFPALLDGNVKSVTGSEVEYFPVDWFLKSVDVDTPAPGVLAVVGARREFLFAPQSR